MFIFNQECNTAVNINNVSTVKRCGNAIVMITNSGEKILMKKCENEDVAAEELEALMKNIVILLGRN